MNELLQFVFDYRNLHGRRSLVPLSQVEHLRLQALDRLLRENPLEHEGSRRRHARVVLDVPALVRVHDRLLPMVIADVSAGGVGIVFSPELSVGLRTTVRVADEDGGRSYNLPVRVAWISDTMAGLEFAGPPVEIRVYHQQSHAA